MSSKKEEDKIAYNRKAAMVKKKSRELQRESWNKFISHLEEETYKLRPKTYKILRRMNADFNEKIYLPKLKMDEAEKYYKNLWTDNDEDSTETPKNVPLGKYEKIKSQELEEAIRKTKNSKAPGEDEIPAELYKYSSIKFKRRLLDFYNLIIEQETIPEEFENAIVVPIFKKGDMAKAENYRGISLLNTCYKIFAKILARRVSEMVEDKMLESQNGFCKGRACTDASFTIKLLMEKRIEHNLEMHMCFVDLEKAYNNVNRKRLYSRFSKNIYRQH
jgi:hypothetical protein